MARALSWPWSERRGKRQQLGAILSLVRFFLFFPSFLGAQSLPRLLCGSYNQLKRRATLDAPDKPLSASQYLLYSAEASSHPSTLHRGSPVNLPSPFFFPALHLGAVTAILTNPIWVVKVRTFTAAPNSPAAHRGLWSACPLGTDFFRCPKA